MILIKGQFSEAKVFVDKLESTARSQIETLCDQPFTAGSRIRIMPDVRAEPGARSAQR